VGGGGLGAVIIGCVDGDDEDGRYWPKHVAIFLLLNTIINPYFHSCGFMTDVYLTISHFYTQRG